MQRILLLALMSLFMVSLQACKDNQVEPAKIPEEEVDEVQGVDTISKDQLYGKWIATFYSSDGEKWNPIPALANDSYIQLNEDNTFVSQMSSDDKHSSDISKGTWDLSGNNLIFTQQGSNDAVIMEISYLKGNQLTSIGHSVYVNRFIWVKYLREY